MSHKKDSSKLQAVHSVSENLGSKLPQLLFRLSFPSNSNENAVSRPIVTANFVSEPAVALLGVTYTDGDDLIDLNESSDSDEDNVDDGENSNPAAPASEDSAGEKESQTVPKEAKEANKEVPEVNDNPLISIENANVKKSSERVPAKQDLKTDVQIKPQPEPLPIKGEQRDSVESSQPSNQETPTQSIANLTLNTPDNHGTPLNEYVTPDRRILDESETPQNPIIEIEPPGKDSGTRPDLKSSITTESKEHIINRVQEPAKSRDALKAQEKKLQESRALEKRRKKDPNKLPFDFQRFLGYLKSKSAESIVKFLKSFLIAFSKKSWTVTEQVKLISDFKNFIYEKMAGVAPFLKMSETEFINCQEGMEKLVMNRLYDQVFSPVIQGSKLDESHAADLRRDERLKNQVLRFGWVTFEHLDLDPEITKLGRSFVDLAVSELIKINNYRLPRDKIICVLNCCKVIFAMLKNSSQQTSADAFIPMLIYVVLKTDEDLRLALNISYIERFRNEDGLAGEVSYYLLSFWAVIGFIEELNKESLTITQEEWDLHMKPFEEAPESETEFTKLVEKQEPQQGSSLVDTEALKNALSPSSIPISQIFTPFQSIQSFFQNVTEDSPSEKLLVDDIVSLRPGTPKIKQQTLAAPTQDSQIITTPTIMKFSSDKALEQSKKQLKAEFLAQKAFEEESAQLVERLEAMFPSLDKEIIKDVVEMNKARATECVDICLSLVSEQ